MMDHVSTYNQLNEFIQLVIQTNGIAYAVDNFITLRDQYYMSKCSDSM